MKNSYIIYFFIFFLSSCISTNQVFFSDPNYLSSDDFSSVERINDAYPEEDINLVDTATNNNEEYYLADDYYDFSYSSRIRRFHRPMMLNYGFYSGFYTDYYWYNPDPFYWGSSIYSGYGWDYPYYLSSPFIAIILHSIITTTLGIIMGIMDIMDIMETMVSIIIIISTPIA